MILRSENEYLRKQLAEAEWSIQQQRGTEEQTLSGSEDEEEESDGVWIMHSVSLCSCSMIYNCWLCLHVLVPSS